MKKINRKFKKVLITGISGSGGSYLAEYILKQDESIVIHGIARSKKSNNLNNLKKNIFLHICDLNDYKKLIKIIDKIRPDVIFHLASNADVRKSFDTPREIIINNNNCTLNLLESIRKLNFNPVIQICSTSEVYGDVPKKNNPINESNAIRPINPYAVSKTFQDQLAFVYFKNYKMNIIITRMFTYFNPRRLNLFASHWADQIAKIEFGLSKKLFHGNLNTSRSFLDIDDAMRAYWLAAKYGKIGEVYNIGGNQNLPLKKFLKQLIKLSNFKIETSLDKNLVRTNDINIQIPSSKKFKKDTGWKPLVTYERSMHNLIEECRERVKKNLTYNKN